MLVSITGELSCTLSCITAAEALCSCACVLATFCKFIATNETAPREVGLPAVSHLFFGVSLYLPRGDNVSVAGQFPQRNIGTEGICTCFQAVTPRGYSP